MLHGRFSGNSNARAWIAADILRIEDGILVEHWDVIQDEASRESSKSGFPLFGEEISDWARILSGACGQLLVEIE